MATASAFSCLPSICFARRLHSAPPFLSLRNVHLHSRVVPGSKLKLVALKEQRSKNCRVLMVKAVGEETQISQQESIEEEASLSEVVPISPSDTLTMYFQAEGTMNETAIPAVTKALEETEGVTLLKVHIVEGIASVELKKQTTVQATGVASGFVETIQGSGFKLQTLNLSFDDEDEAAV